FGDRWAGGIKYYIEWMANRVREIHRILKPSGSMFLHCDWHAGHRLRVMLDEIFGENNFMNEIIWNYGERMMGKSKFFDRKHDTIFFYAKSNNKERTFNKITEKYTIEEIRSWRGTKIDKDGREYTLRDGGKGKPRYKAYIDDIMKKGKPLSDVWNIKIIGSASKERCGYKTQKPLGLIKRIIECSTNQGDLILDCFAGGGLPPYQRRC
ncbi:MAG: site-specific DNA-methyltransferase, partial [Halobacteriovoraceae bacterium]|nr:site-specific DNA-methyltransferase [Halobacteriovoraceae bacterium]